MYAHKRNALYLKMRSISKKLLRQNRKTKGELGCLGRFVKFSVVRVTMYMNQFLHPDMCIYIYIADIMCTPDRRQSKTPPPRRTQTKDRQEQISRLSSVARLAPNGHRKNHTSDPRHAPAGRQEVSRLPPIWCDMNQSFQLDMRPFLVVFRF